MLSSTSLRSGTRPVIVTRLAMMIQNVQINSLCFLLIRFALATCKFSIMSTTSIPFSATFCMICSWFGYFTASFRNRSRCIIIGSLNCCFRSGTINAGGRVGAAIVGGLARVLIISVFLLFEWL